MHAVSTSQIPVSSVNRVAPRWSTSRCMWNKLIYCSDRSNVSFINSDCGSYLPQLILYYFSQSVMYKFNARLCWHNTKTASLRGVINFIEITSLFRDLLRAFEFVALIVSHHDWDTAVNRADEYWRTAKAVTLTAKNLILCPLIYNSKTIYFIDLLFIRVSLNVCSLNIV